MRLPLRSWNRTLTSLGFSAAKGERKKKLRPRQSRFEPLDPREMLTGVAVNDTGSTNANVKLVVSAPGLLNNDTYTPGVDTLTVTTNQNPSTKGAVAVVSANGSYTYDPRQVVAFRQGRSRSARRCRF